MLPKFIVYSLSFIVLILFTIHPALAQTPSTSSGHAAIPSASSSTPYTLYPIPSSVSPTSPLYTDLLVNNLFHSFSCLAIGQSVIGQPCLTYQVTKNAQGAIQSIPVLSSINTSGGTLGAVTSVIGMLYTNPPVRTADYLASVGTDLGIVKQVHAQGVGGSGAAVLNPILKLWQVSRNISYVILIIIFLIIGLMVMFRNKINPQTVITAQTALPGLVIGLVMITFSYFFAGLISDSAFIGTNLVGYYFSAAQKQSTPQNVVESMQNQNVLSIFSPFIGIVNKENAADLISSIWTSLNQDTRNFLTGISAFLVGQMTSPVGSLFGPVGQMVVGFGTSTVTLANPTGIVGVLLWIMATLILLYSMFKLLLRLINNYLTIIFLTFTAPFQLLIAALPGRQGMATNWILNMLANILAFPAVLAVLYFVAYLMGPVFMNLHCTTPCPFKITQVNQINSNDLVPNAYAEGASIVDSQTFPLFGGMNLDFMRLLLAFGALIALPSIPDVLGRAIGKMGETGQLIGQEIGGSVGQGRGYFGQASRAPGALAQQVGPVINQPGYMMEGGKVVRVYDPRFGGSFGIFSKFGSWRRPKGTPP
ncbi:hypothetical protein HYU45_00880 [Candidatus Daviesbacteria bacterium]|nr:hypothetical protein [Candidatus Daviesbacteria bacterium]